MDDIIDQINVAMKGLRHTTPLPATEQAHTTLGKALYEIERLRGVIDCGCNAIRDAVALGGSDIKRIDAVQRRMRREMSVGDTTPKHDCFYVFNGCAHPQSCKDGCAAKKDSSHSTRSGETYG